MNVNNNSFPTIFAGNVFQCSAGAAVKRSENTNAMIMDYLKKVVPRMFQVICSHIIEISLNDFAYFEINQYFAFVSFSLLRILYLCYQLP